jgi:hypothetical protein
MKMLLMIIIIVSRTSRNFWFVTRLTLCSGLWWLFEKSKPSSIKITWLFEWRTIVQTNKWICFIMMTVTIHRPLEMSLEIRFLFNFENRYVTKSGTVVWLLWTSLPIESDSICYCKTSPIRKNLKRNEIYI